jgi:hypothetical protein
MANDDLEKRSENQVNKELKIIKNCLDFRKIGNAVLFGEVIMAGMNFINYNDSGSFFIGLVAYCSLGLSERSYKKDLNEFNNYQMRRGLYK